MKIAVDFDGTIVEHEYPEIGREKPFAVDTLKHLAADGHKLILWTVRSGKELKEALKWCDERGLHFYAVNGNLPEGAIFPHPHDGSPKVLANIYIDDANIGGIPEWPEIYEIISGKAQNSLRRHSRRALFRRLFGL